MKSALSGSRSIIGQDLLPSQITVSTKDIIVSSVALVVLLNILAPAVAVFSPIPLLVSVGIVMCAYFAFIIINGSIGEGIVSAAVVLTTYSADVPVLSGPGGAEFGILLADLVIFPCIVGLLYVERHDLSFGAYSKYTAGALSFFVFWSYISAAISNGPSSVNAIAFSLSVTRYLFYFIFAALLIRWVSVLDAIYPLLVATAGHTVVAIAESHRGKAYGFTRLGDATGSPLGEFDLWFVEFTSGLFAGGFSGSSRILISLLLIVTPLAVAVTIAEERTRLLKFAALAFPPFTIVMVQISDTDAGLGAMILVFGLIIIFSGYSLFVRGNRRFKTSVYGTVSGIALTLLLFMLGREKSPTGRQSGSAGVGAGTTNQSDGSPTNGSSSTGPTNGSSSTGPTNGSSSTGPTNGSSSTGPTNGSSSTGPTNGSSSTGPTNGSSSTGPTNGSSEGGGNQIGADSSPTGLQKEILELFQGIPGFQSNTLLIRLQQYAAAVDLGAQYPLFGIGGWNFVMVSESYGFDKPRVIHNTYLAHLAEVGILGALAFVISVTLPIIIAIQLSQESEASDAFLWWSFAFGLLAFHAYAFWTSIYHSAVAYSVLWLLNGIIVGAKYHDTSVVSRGGRADTE
ncbi:O-Antigen ligase [Natronoarchaeum philippinense]|uniref:O-Antigen ligase n=1 Tax=Natronoarchaeum philippinense TaxID=558529 RepID=A0A285P2N0_NATPI|nr:O-antigen ligase family protein [Natronoarchaeum philippinense]SNZ15413.1 O-Antigen ligase [Natronoarchaeum philippinense]